MKLSSISHNWRLLRKVVLPLLCLLSFAIALLADSFTPAFGDDSSTPEIQTPRQEIRGVWMTKNDFNILKDRDRVQEAVEHLRRLNFNTIYPVIWNSGYTQYPSAVAQQHGIPFFYYGLQGQDILADLIDRSHAQNLLVIPWFEFGFMVPQTSELALNHPEWLTKQKNGTQTSVSAAGEVAWLNPFHPDVQNFIQDLVVEVVDRYDVDGIQFDDHMSLPREFGYDEYTVSSYHQETQKNPPDNPNDSDWVRWRADKITAFMEQLDRAVKERKPHAIFSVAPNYYDFAYKLQLQDWLTWVRRDIADELIVQVYRSNLDSFTQKISLPEVVEAHHKIPTGVGIMTGLRNRPVPIQQIKEQARSAQDLGLGTAFFYYESLWDYAPESESEADRQSEFQALFPSPAVRIAQN